MKMFLLSLTVAFATSLASAQGASRDSRLAGNGTHGRDYARESLWRTPLQPHTTHFLILGRKLGYEQTPYGNQAVYLATDQGFETYKVRVGARIERKVENLQEGTPIWVAVCDLGEGEGDPTFLQVIDQAPKGAVISRIPSDEGILAATK